ncbi:MAG: hypothetical protein U9Q81_15395 [Pseudomonadota bacterium]|nr:hypothetical protein [Pseudomonadota bacterium]
MPKDEFERLERRWRKRPLFPRRRSRGPLWLLAGLAITISLLLGLAAIERPSAEQLFHRLMNVGVDAPANQTAHATPQAYAPFGTFTLNKIE